MRWRDRRGEERGRYGLRIAFLDLCDFFGVRTQFDVLLKGFARALCPSFLPRIAQRSQLGVVGGSIESS
jgi:hypothetical protein